MLIGTGGLIIIEAQNRPRIVVGISAVLDHDRIQDCVSDRIYPPVSFRIESVRWEGLYP